MTRISKTGKPDSKYFAHSADNKSDWQPLKEHLRNVGDCAANFAEVFGAAEEGRVAGLLHDIGKYGDLFQRRLHGRERGIDHWSPGAWIALQNRGIAAAASVLGHHLGLGMIGRDELKKLEPSRLAKEHKDGLRLSEKCTELLLQRLEEDGLKLPEIPGSIYGDKIAYTAASMLDVRMLFSALVDADFIDTEDHFRRTGKDIPERPAPLPIDPELAFDILNRHIQEVSENSQAAEEVNRLRNDLLGACIEAAKLPKGLFTLTAPTGAGKTLAMLAFALKHAAIHKLRRIVMVIPYLTIIEQTAKLYREVFEPVFGELFVLEHHSLSDTGDVRDEDLPSDDKDSEENTTRARRLLAQNWDAPVIVTTSVQLLESLFSNRPSTCRKLHNLANSVILFDEVQTLPPKLAIPTLAALARLTERYGASVVFATATQPAFGHFHQKVSEDCRIGWQPREIASPGLKLFSRIRRTRVHWHSKEVKVTWEVVAERLLEHDQVLCIVNLRRHARHLAEILLTKNVEGLYHLSTTMCPVHRRDVLTEVRERLEKGLPCRLVSTQCVEAGVDVDFPVLYRAFGPLEAIAQAAGRCNRNGNTQYGDVHIFIPEDERLYPTGAYAQAAATTSILFKDFRASGMDIDDPALFERYYMLLYDLTKPECKELNDAIKEQNFKVVASKYRLIGKDSINILVSYDKDAYLLLSEKVRKEGLTSQWMKQAQLYSVGEFRTKRLGELGGIIEPVPLWRGQGTSDDWFILTMPDKYHDVFGLDSRTFASDFVL